MRNKTREVHFWPLFQIRKFSSLPDRISNHKGSCSLLRYANTVRERLCGEIWLALSQQNHMCVIACFQPNDDVNMPKLVKEITSKVNKSGHISSKVSNWRVNKCLANLDQSKSSFRSFLTNHKASVQQHVTTLRVFPACSWSRPEFRVFGAVRFSVLREWFMAWPSN